jgi:hypothetical protein
MMAHQTPSRSAILKATVIALAVAVVILFTIVLPAEYAIDPLKTGALLGLTNLAGGTAGAGGRATPAQAGISTPQPTIYKVDAEDFGLHPGQAVELKYHMKKGAAMVFGWKASANLTFEFHGEPDQKPRPDYFDTYQLDNKTGQDQSYGSFTAPSTGIHGWYFQNKTGSDVTFRLTTAGFYDWAKMYAGGSPEDIPVEEVK